jgi:hypothetical protein
MLAADQLMNSHFFQLVGRVRVYGTHVRACSRAAYLRFLRAVEPSRVLYIDVVTYIREPCDCVTLLNPRRALATGVGCHGGGA